MRIYLSTSPSILATLTLVSLCSFMFLVSSANKWFGWVNYMYWILIIYFLCWGLCSDQNVVVLYCSAMVDPGPIELSVLRRQSLHRSSIVWDADDAEVYLYYSLIFFIINLLFIKFII